MRFRRISATVLLIGVAVLTACSREAPLSAPSAAGQQVIVLGIDGMDWGLTQQLMEDGRLPNFARLAREGYAGPLETSSPALSPVAWSDFITGMDSGGHGIFDFVHRDPQTMLPYLSTSKAPEGEEPYKLGKYIIPRGGGEVELLRQGTPFWELLEAEGIESWILRMPANYPPSGTATRELSGMGTPDLLGTYGTFSFHSTDLFFEERKVSGGELYPMDFIDNQAIGTLHAVDHPFLAEETTLTTEFSIFVDSEAPVGLLRVGEEERILKVGEWSNWVPVEFDMSPLPMSLTGMCRFYLRQIKPEVEVYVSPINVDPLDPAQRISTPEDYAAELAEASGRFYTQGMPEDTHSLRQGVFTRDEFLSQAKIAGDEIKEQFQHVLNEFQTGFLFYYFGNLDQTAHMMWRALDPTHPAYDAERDPQVAKVILGLYDEMDALVGETLEREGEDTLLIVMSDHGFASWKRAFHLNQWLFENGYLALKNPDIKKDPGLYLNVDWSRTRAYGLGLNGLYVNLRGRERNGIVHPSDRELLMSELQEKLLAVTDPQTESPAITRVYLREEWYQDRGHLEIGPDIVMGYAKGTKLEESSAIGEFPEDGQVFGDNTGEWSGDHSMDHITVPGVLFTSRPLKQPAPRLRDLAGSILAEFGIQGFPHTVTPTD